MPALRPAGPEGGKDTPSHWPPPLVCGFPKKTGTPAG